MIHDRGRIWLNPCRDQVGQFGSYLRVSPNDICPECALSRAMETPIVSCSKTERGGGSQFEYDENEVAAVTGRIWAFGVDDRGI